MSNIKADPAAIAARQRDNGKFPQTSVKTVAQKFTQSRAAEWRESHVLNSTERKKEKTRQSF